MVTKMSFFKVYHLEISHAFLEISHLIASFRKDLRSFNRSGKKSTSPPSPHLNPGQKIRKSSEHAKVAAIFSSLLQCTMMRLFLDLSLKLNHGFLVFFLRKAKQKWSRASARAYSLCILWRAYQIKPSCGIFVYFSLIDGYNPIPSYT